MAKGPRRPLYQDYQPPDLFRAGVTLRRSFLTGPADEQEAELAKLIADVEQPEKTQLMPKPGKPADKG